MKGASALARMGRKMIRVLHASSFSSRRRHTRFDCDWSSDVCSSDLALVLGAGTIGLCAAAALRARHPAAEVLVSAAWPHVRERVAELGATPIGTGTRAVTDRKSVVQGKSVDLGGRRIIKQKNDIRVK